MASSHVRADSFSKTKIMRMGNRKSCKQNGVRQRDSGKRWCSFRSMSEYQKQTTEIRSRQICTVQKRTLLGRRQEAFIIRQPHIIQERILQARGILSRVQTKDAPAEVIRNETKISSMESEIEGKSNDIKESDTDETGGKKKKASVSFVDLIRWGALKVKSFLISDRHGYLPGLEGSALLSCSAQFPPFVFVNDGDSFLATIDRLVQEGKFSEKVKSGLIELFTNYKGALMSNDKEADADGEAAKMIASIAERVAFQYLSPYTFPSRHERILTPFNYFLFGQRYCGNLINFNSSYVGNIEGFVKIREQLDMGDNVVIMANHQSEADPGVWAWMTQYISPSLSTDVYYVAGDRVVLDTFAKPFSMGRNLICVHSKRHMEDDPLLRAEKMKTNQRSVRELGNMLKEGGALIWIAPSGGRDRIDPEIGTYRPAVFDPSAVQLLKRLVDKNSKSHKGHIYPMAMVSAEIMPPPGGVEKVHSVTSERVKV